MDRISFRPDGDLVQILGRAQRETGLNPSELCRVAIAEYIAKQSPQKIIKANAARRIARAKQWSGVA